MQFPDFSKPFLVTTDASSYALGAVLSQGEIGHDLPISFAIIFAVRQVRPYMYGRKFALVIDHRPLVWLYKLKDPVSRLNL